MAIKFGGQEKGNLGPSFRKGSQRPNAVQDFKQASPYSADLGHHLPLRPKKDEDEDHDHANPVRNIYFTSTDARNTKRGRLGKVSSSVREFLPDEFTLRAGYADQGSQADGVQILAYENLTEGTDTKFACEGIVPASLLRLDSNHRYARWQAYLANKYLVSAPYGDFKIVHSVNVDDSVTTFPRYEDAIVMFQRQDRITGGYNIRGVKLAGASNEPWLLELFEQEGLPELSIDTSGDPGVISRINAIEYAANEKYLVTVHACGVVERSDATIITAGPPALYYFGDISNSIEMRTQGIKWDASEGIIYRDTLRLGYQLSHRDTIDVRMDFVWSFIWDEQYEKVKIFLDPASGNYAPQGGDWTGYVRVDRLGNRGAKASNTTIGSTQFVAPDYPLDWDPGGAIFPGIGFMKLGSTFIVG